MSELVSTELLKLWRFRIILIIHHLLKSWLFLLLALIIGAAIGAYFILPKKPVYTSTITFVLSTEQQKGGNALAGLASQLGFDASTSGTENIFSGDNIIELFKSRKLIGEALLLPIENNNGKNLLTYIVETQNPKKKELLPFPDDPLKFTKVQKMAFRNAISQVSGSFLVFKKDPKLVFFTISSTSTDDDYAYYVSTTILKGISSFFIDTKTKVTTNSLSLLQKEADSLGHVLNNMYQSVASMNDRSYNINPSITVQRAPALLTQAKAAAISTAYTEVMRNLEITKINLQKETPLYRIIDEPELPLAAQSPNKLLHIILTSLLAFIIMFMMLIVEKVVGFLI